MRIIKCDYCKAEVSEYTGNPPIVVDNLAPEAGIALPSNCYHHEFCTRECLVAWLEDYCPRAFHAALKK